MTLHAKGFMEYFLKFADCSNTTSTALDCLRSASADKLNNASMMINDLAHGPLSTVFGILNYLISAPILDGIHFKRQATESLKLGMFRKIPIMINTNSDEGALFFLKNDVEGPNTYIKRLLPYMNDTELEELKALYSEKDIDFADNNDGAINVLSDYMFQCPALKMARAYDHFGLPVIKTFFSQRMAILQLGKSKMPPAHGMYLLLSLILGMYFSGGKLMLFCSERKEL
jgi:carboxylesterase type B